MKILLYGSSGWIGSQLISLLSSHTVINSTVRLEDYDKIAPELETTQPTHVIIAAGKTGRPNIDWCETHRLETLQTNVIGTAAVVDECHRRGIHVTYLGTGCIYEYDKDHPIGGPGFTEEDEPNFNKSFYSYSKIMTEKILKEYENVLVLRIRMPITSTLHPRNFITKIINYEKVVNIPNSMSVLDDLLPLIPDMMERRISGVYNFTNPGVISHNEILDLYREYINPEFKYVNFSIEEHDKVVKAKRSNNYLDASKLRGLYPQIPEIGDSIELVFKRMKELN